MIGGYFSHRRKLEAPTIGKLKVPVFRKLEHATFLAGESASLHHGAEPHGPETCDQILECLSGDLELARLRNQAS